MTLSLHFAREQNVWTTHCLAVPDPFCSRAKWPDGPLPQDQFHTHEGRFNRPSVVMGATKSKGGLVMSP